MLAQVLLLVASIQLGSSESYTNFPQWPPVPSYPYSVKAPPVPSEGVPWPLPKYITFGPANLTLDPSGLQIITKSACRLITEAVQRYKNIISRERGPRHVNKVQYGRQWTRDTQLISLTIIVDSESECNQYPYLGMNENYKLVINDTGTGLLRAPSVWGALRGLETFSQLIYLVKAPNDGPYEYALRIRTAAIDDQPRFEHRGLLLDTSRHFLSVNTIKKNLDLMAFAKYNVFHWHIVDDPSFPYMSAVYPDLARKGAYTNKHVYSAQDISNIVEYARLRGIRVIPEFDTPGHALSWGGQPNLLTQCYSHGHPVYDYGVIDPTVNTTYDFLQRFFTEIMQRFPDKYIHLGGDEVSFDCWRSNPNVQAAMRRLNMTYGQEAKLEEYYIQKLIALIKLIRRSSNGAFMVWQEVFDNGAHLDSDTVVHVWKGDYHIQWAWELFKVTHYGRKAILSSCWYLNNLLGQHNEKWDTYYACDPQHFVGTAYQKSLVIGGEACMWGEYVDGTNVIPLLWPRASVVAERLWSKAEVNDVNKARPRLEELRCRLLRRGYQVAPINGPGFCQFEWDA